MTDGQREGDPTEAAADGSGSRMLLDVLAYFGARLALAAVLGVVIFAVGRFVTPDFPVTVAALFAIVLAFPLGIWVFAPLRRRATASIGSFDERRRRDRDALRARLRGEEPTEP